MTFNTKDWLDAIVRTSDYTLPEELPTFDSLDVPVSELIEQLGSIRSLNVDEQQTAALLPARLQPGTPVPSALQTHFEDVVQGLAAYGIELHPGVRHALLAVALASPNKNEKLESLKPLFTGIDNGLVYQPTMTWMALLKPEWFEPKHPIVPMVKGGTEPSKATQGVTTTIGLAEDNMRINPAHMFTWAKPIELTSAKIPAPPEEWRKIADAAWDLPNPPATSLWLMSFGTQDKWWPFLTPGAALYNPFYDQDNINALFQNSTQHNETSYFTRMGHGIADIYPIEKDTVLANYAPLGYLLDAAPSLNTWLSMYHHAKSNSVVFQIPPEWVTQLRVKVELVKSLDLLPQYSIFSDASLEETLSQYQNSLDINDLTEFMQNAIAKQMLLASQTNNAAGDVFDIGLPVDKFFVPTPVIEIPVIAPVSNLESTPNE